MESAVGWVQEEADVQSNFILSSLTLKRAVEAKHMGEIVSLDEVTKFENRDRHAFVPDSNITNPAQIYIAKETHKELHAALDTISNREREYLLYRFGFEDDMEHPLTETAEHFFLSESRAKSTEKLALDNVWLELPWWFH